MKLFLKLFPEELFELIAFQTNVYATQQNTSYQPTCTEEIKIFFGINMFMAMKKLPSYRDYWSTSSDFHNHYIAPLIQMNRFGWLLGHLYLNDNSIQPKKGDPNYDKLYKIRPLLTIGSNVFRMLFTTSKSCHI